MDKLWYTHTFKDKDIELAKLLEEQPDNYLASITRQVIKNINEDEMDGVLFRSDHQFLRQTLLMEYDCLKPALFLKDKIKFFADIDSKQLNLNPNSKLYIIRKNEILDLLHDFFKNATTPEFDKIFSKIVSLKNICVFSDDSVTFDGDSIYLPYYEEQYMRFNYSFNFNDAVTGAHESGHGIEQYLNPASSLYFGLFDEVISTFFEFLFANYYTNSPDFSEDSITCSALQFYRNNYTASRLLDDFYLVKQVEPKGNRTLEESVRYYIRKNKKFVRDVLNSNTLNDFPYMIGYLIAIELYYIYLQDRDKAFYLVKKICEMHHSDDYGGFINYLEFLGININEHVEDYQAYLKRKLK